MHNKGCLVEDSLYALKNPKKTKFEYLLKNRLLLLLLDLFFYR